MSGTKKKSIVVGAIIMLSRVTGLVRDMLTSRVIGAGFEQSAFTTAFLIPNLFRKLFGEGALTNAIVPYFVEDIKGDRKHEAQKLVSHMFTAVFCLLSALCILIISCTSLCGDMFGAKCGRIFELLRITMPYAIFICSAALGGCLLNSIGKFYEFAVAPILLNIMWIGILIVLYFCPSMSIADKVVAVSWTVLLGGVVQMLFMFCSARKYGFRIGFKFKKLRNPRTKTIFKNMGVGCWAASFSQINVFVDQGFAYYAGDWSPAAISFADRIIYLPLGVFATAMGQVLLTSLSEKFLAKDYSGASIELKNFLVRLGVLIIPMSVALMILAPEVVRLIYKGGVFGEGDVANVSRALVFYAMGLSAISFNKLLILWFNSQKDLNTPAKIATRLVCLNFILNAILVFSLPNPWKHTGLAASSSICAFVNMVIFVVLAKRKEHNELVLSNIRKPIVGVIVSSLFLALVLMLGKYFFSSVYGTSWIGSFVALSIFGVVGSFLYFVTLRVVSKDVYEDALGFVIKRFKRIASR